MTRVSTMKLFAGAVSLALGLGLPAAHASHLRHHHRHHLARLAGPSVVAPADYDNPLTIPGQRNDPDLGATPADGIQAGREAPFLSTEDVRREFGVAPGPGGFELEGPPIGASLPVIR